jgi:hypothetical protein
MLIPVAQTLVLGIFSHFVQFSEATFSVALPLPLSH